MLDNRLARYWSGNTTVKSVAPAPAASRPVPRNSNQVASFSSLDLYRLAYEQAREEAQRKWWSRNRIRQYFE